MDQNIGSTVSVTGVSPLSLHLYSPTVWKKEVHKGENWILRQREEKGKIKSWRRILVALSNPFKYVLILLFVLKNYQYSKKHVMHEEYLNERKKQITVLT